MKSFITLWVKHLLKLQIADLALKKKCIEKEHSIKIKIVFYQRKFFVCNRTIIVAHQQSY